MFVAWQECYDDVSGFIYYWNTQTNKVTWEKPEYYEAAQCVENQGMLNKDCLLLAKGIVCGKNYLHYIGL